MSLDALTWSALLISLATIVALVVLIRGTNRRNQESLRCVARHMARMQDDPEMRQLCSVLHEQYPDLCVGLDFELTKGDKGAQVKKWMNQNPEPDQKQVKAMLEKLKSA